MKIVLLKSKLDAHGGLEKYTHHIVTECVKRKIGVTILTTHLPKSPLAGVSYHACPVTRFPGFWKIEQFDRAVHKFLEKEHSPIVFGMDRNRRQTHLRLGNGIHAAYLKSRAASEGKIRHLLHRFNPLHQKILEIERCSFAHPGLQKVFPNSYMVQKELLTHYPIDPAKVEVIHNGVEWKAKEVSFAVWQIGRTQCCDQLHLDPNPLHLLFIGNGYARKGLSPLLHALSIWQFKDFHLSILGKEKNQKYYQALIEKLGLKTRARIFGLQPDLTPFYQLADSLIIPSFYDPFANVTLEALAMGVFVVSSKTNGGHEILSPDNGVLIEDVLSPDAIVHSLNCALLHKKTPLSAFSIRNSIAHLDFAHQLPKLLEAL
ncbi:MAG: glycosyltransferase family 4 protein [Chlamydiia bacterium]|nr:glycosyltransferase family 4 protein [Chlamydiia bacterium]